MKILKIFSEHYTSMSRIKFKISKTFSKNYFLPLSQNFQLEPIFFTWKCKFFQLWKENWPPFPTILITKRVICKLNISVTFFFTQRAMIKNAKKLKYHTYLSSNILLSTDTNKQWNSRHISLITHRSSTHLIECNWSHDISTSSDDCFDTCLPSPSDRLGSDLLPLTSNYVLALTRPPTTGEFRYRKQSRSYPCWEELPSEIIFIASCLFNTENSKKSASESRFFFQMHMKFLPAQFYAIYVIIWSISRLHLCR